MTEAMIKTPDRLPIVRGILRGVNEIFQILEPYIYLAPAFIIFTVFIFVPLVFSIYLSFTNWDLISKGADFIWFNNYLRLAHNKNFWGAVKNTIYFTIGIVPAQIALALISALLLNTKVKFKSLFRSIYFLPVIVPITVTAIVWLFIFSPSYGILNYLIGIVGLPQPRWLYDPVWALPALIVLAVWTNFGYFTVIFLAGLQSIPREMIEAAEIDGANKWQSFWKITFPLLSPTTFLVLIMSIIGGFQIYQTVVLTTEGGPAGATNVIVYELYRTAFEYFDMGYASAMATLLFFLLFSLTLFQFRVVGSRVHYG
jgi:multiple sugar transport system permease protein